MTGSEVRVAPKEDDPEFEPRGSLNLNPIREIGAEHADPLSPRELRYDLATRRGRRPTGEQPERETIALCLSGFSWRGKRLSLRAFIEPQ
jgi:hypothetical protein